MLFRSDGSGDGGVTVGWIGFKISDVDVSADGGVAIVLFYDDGVVVSKK